MYLATNYAVVTAPLNCAPVVDAENQTQNATVKVTWIETNPKFI